MVHMRFPARRFVFPQASRTGPAQARAVPWTAPSFDAPVAVPQVFASICSLKPPSMPDKEEAQRIVVPLLARSERVLWTGRPEVGSVFWKVLRGALGFVVVAAAILYFFYAEAVVRIGHRMMTGEASLAAYAFPAAVTSLMLWSLRSTYRRTRRTAYALTDRRLLSTEGTPNRPVRSVSGSFGAGEWSLFPEQVAFVRVRKERSGVGDVVFNRYRAGGTTEGSTLKWVGFQQISDPQEVCAQVRAWLEEREREAVAETDARRSFTDADRELRLDLPARWQANDTSEQGTGEGGRVYVLGNKGPLGLRDDAPGTERLLERYGPLGASFSLSTGPAGTWHLEGWRNVGDGGVRIAECVQAQPEVRVGALHGFAVTLGLTVTPTLFGHPSRQDAEARVKLVVLSHDARQYRFALAWLCAFPAMKEPLEQIVRSFRVDDT